MPRLIRGTMIEVSDSPHQRLATLSGGLLRLHKSLLDAERAAYERDVARITSTGPVSAARARRSVVRLAA